MSKFSGLKHSLKIIQEHADKLYELVSASNPDGKMFRREGEEKTEQDKRISAACWHGHEINKYLAAARYRIQAMEKTDGT